MVQSLGWEDPLEKGMATHSSILAWRAPVHGVAKSWTHVEISRDVEKEAQAESQCPLRTPFQEPASGCP